MSTVCRVIRSYFGEYQPDYDIIRAIMSDQPSRPDDSFSSFLEMIKNEPSFPPYAQQNTTPDALEESIIQLLTLLKRENGMPVLAEDLYAKSGLSLQLFGEALQVMRHEELIVISDAGQVTLAPGIQEQI
jgi:hypothetical protein